MLRLHLAAILHCARLGLLCSSHPQIVSIRRRAMPTLTREIREQLLTYDENFQKLAQQHSEYEAQLKQLWQSTYLNLEDLQRQVTLKKLKLSVKDAMERYIPSVCVSHRGD